MTGTKGQSMRAAVYTGAKTFTVEQRPQVAPQAEEVQLEVAYTGICGTDLHIFHGDMDARVAAPAVIGHEMSGRILHLGSGVTGWSVGDPVTVMPLVWCGACPACRAGNEHLCHRLNFIGIDSAGSMQGRWTVPTNTLVRLPEALDLRHAALVEPVAVAVHDVRRSGLSAGEKAVVVGGGPIGLLIATVARHSGADVLLVEPDPFRRHVAELGGLVTVDPTTVTVPELVEEWSAGAGAAVAFEVSGAAAGVQTAVDVLAVRGRLVLVAIHPTPRPVNLHRFFWRELTLIGARLYRRADFERAVELVSEAVLPAESLISRVVPIDQVAEAFAALESSAGVMKVLIDCQAAGQNAAGTADAGAQR
jgi:(R,R)-butanediol dehydrogenase/meso-butanediol dehydrogenase/diacetyl reductase